MYNFLKKFFVPSSIHLMMKMVNPTKWFWLVKLNRLSRCRSYSLFKVSYEELIVAVAFRIIDILDDYRSFRNPLFSNRHWPDHPTPCSRSAEIEISYCVWIVCRTCMILIVCIIYYYLLNTYTKYTIIFLQ